MGFQETTRGSSSTSSVPQNGDTIPEGRLSVLWHVLSENLEGFPTRRAALGEGDQLRWEFGFSHASLLVLPSRDPPARSLQILTLFAYEQIVLSLLTCSTISSYLIGLYFGLVDCVAVSDLSHHPPICEQPGSGGRAESGRIVEEVAEVTRLLFLLRSSCRGLDYRPRALEVVGRLY